MFREFYMQYRSTLDLTASLRIHHQVVVRGPAQKANEELWSKLLDLEKSSYLFSIFDSIANCAVSISAALKLLASIKAQLSQLGADIVCVDRSFVEEPSVDNSFNHVRVDVDGLLQALVVVEPASLIRFSTEVTLLEQDLDDCEQKNREFFSRKA